MKVEFSFKVSIKDTNCIINLQILDNQICNFSYFIKRMLSVYLNIFIKFIPHFSWYYNKLFNLSSFYQGMCYCLNNFETNIIPKLNNNIKLIIK